jgi:NADH-quinone oxidoreductase subunit C
MEETLEQILKDMKERFAAEITEYAGDSTVNLTAEFLLDAMQTLRDEYHFNMIIDVTAVDYWPAQEPRFHMVYHVYSMLTNQFLRLRVPLNGNDPHIPTVEKLFPGANWREREIYDLFGITFDSHSDLRRILMPYDWQGHPLRKDYPLGYEEVQFTFNAAEVDKRKSYAKD